MLTTGPSCPIYVQITTGNQFINPITSIIPSPPHPFLPHVYHNIYILDDTLPQPHTHNHFITVLSTFITLLWPPLQHTKHSPAHLSFSFWGGGGWKDHRQIWRSWVDIYIYIYISSFFSTFTSFDRFLISWVAWCRVLGHQKKALVKKARQLSTKVRVLIEHNKLRGFIGYEEVWDPQTCSLGSRAPHDISSFGLIIDEGSPIRQQMLSLVFWGLLFWG